MARYPQGARGHQRGRAAEGPGPDSPGNRRLGHLELAPERVVPETPLHRASCLPYKPPKAPTEGPLSRRGSRNRAFMAAITACGERWSRGRWVIRLEVFASGGARASVVRVMVRFARGLAEKSGGERGA